MISQREARRLRKRVEALEARQREQMRSWSSEYPGGVHLDSIEVSPAEYAIVATARKLGHAVVLTTDKQNWVRVYGIRLDK